METGINGFGDLEEAINLLRKRASEQVTDEKSRNKLMVQMVAERLGKFSKAELSQYVNATEEVFGVEYYEDPKVEGLIVVYRPKRPKFALETFADCVEDACSAAGGTWNDKLTVPACVFSGNFVERHAKALLYDAYVLECTVRSFGTLIKGALGGA
jgi:hypothetical protein